MCYKIRPLKDTLNGFYHHVISHVTLPHYITLFLHSTAAFMIKPCYVTAAADISPSARHVHYPVIGPPKHLDFTSQVFWGSCAGQETAIEVNVNVNGHSL